MFLDRPMVEIHPGGGNPRILVDMVGTIDGAFKV
jgi:hypothetical protein